MATKTAMLMTRIEPQLKADAEKILDQLGISSSVVINCLYKQIVLRKAIPFALSLVTPPKARDEMTDEELEERLLKSYREAQAGQGEAADVVLQELLEGLHQ